MDGFTPKLSTDPGWRSVDPAPPTVGPLMLLYVTYIGCGPIIWTDGLTKPCGGRVIQGTGRGVVRVTGRTHLTKDVAEQVDWTPNFLKWIDLVPNISSHKEIGRHGSSMWFVCRGCVEVGVGRVGAGVGRVGRVVVGIGRIGAGVGRVRAGVGRVGAKVGRVGAGEEVGVVWMFKRMHLTDEADGHGAWNP